MQLILNTYLPIKVHNTKNIQNLGNVWNPNKNIFWKITKIFPGRKSYYFITFLSLNHVSFWHWDFDMKSTVSFMEQIQMKKILSKIYYSRLNFCVEKKSQKKPRKVFLKIFQHHIDFLTAHYQLVVQLDIF